MNSFRQTSRWFRSIAVTLLLSIIVNTAYAAASCACGMDVEPQMSEMMDCHSEDAATVTPTANECCPSCIMLYPTEINSLDTVFSDFQPALLKADEFFTQNVTPLYRPPIIYLL